MELQIKEYTPIDKIDFNFEELKNEVADKMTFYKGLVYTDAQIAEAKADRARLRKFIDALDARRKEIKADINAPYVEFESRLNEIKSIINEPIALIDTQIKDYEEIVKDKKKNEILTVFEAEIGGREIAFDLVFSARWLNATYSMAKVKEDITDACKKYDDGMAVLNNLDDFRFDAKEVFIETLDLARALTYANEQKARAERKAEYESRLTDNKAEATSSKTSGEKINTVDNEVEIRFSVMLTKEKAKKLKEFMTSNDIKFQQI